jgi:hypothetical protein
VAGTSQPVTAEDVAHFLVRFATVSAKYGYWNATPEENAAVGIRL